MVPKHVYNKLSIEMKILHNNIIALEVANRKAWPSWTEHITQRAKGLCFYEDFDAD